MGQNFFSTLLYFRLESFFALFHKKQTGLDSMTTSLIWFWAGKRQQQRSGRPFCEKDHNTVKKAAAVVFSSTFLYDRFFVVVTLAIESTQLLLKNNKVHFSFYYQTFLRSASLCCSIPKKKEKKSKLRPAIQHSFISNIVPHF